MAVGSNQPLNFPAFMHGLARVLVRLMKKRAFGEVVIVLQDGHVANVRVNQNHRPQNIVEDTEL